MAPPPVGASEEAVGAYLDHLEYDVLHTSRRMEHAKRTGDVAEARRLEMKREEKDAFHLAERDRLTERDMGMVVGGGVTLGIGGASLIASAALLATSFFAALSQVGSSDEDRGPAPQTLIDASLATLAIGIAGVTVGIPTLIVGVRQRHVRSPDDIGGRVGQGPAVSGANAGLLWSF